MKHPHSTSHPTSPPPQAYGESSAKSSTVPQEAKSLAKLYVHEVACGFGHSLFIVRDDDDDDRKAIEAMPRYAGP